MALPAALIAYNRADVLERTLACLRAAGVTRIHAYADGPRDAADEPRVAAVRGLLERVDWADVRLTARDRNLGLSESMVGALNDVFAHEERALVIEDDVAIAPEFPEFAAAALDRYADEERVVGVTANRPPFSKRPLRGYPYDAFLLPRFFTWGWATWARAWRTFEFHRERLLARLRDPAVRLEVAGADVPYMVRKAIVQQRLHGSWDVYAAASMVVNDQLFVVPTWNMTEVPGLGSGTHPQRPRWQLRWEPERRPDLAALRLPPVEVDQAILKSYHVFRENPRGWTPRRLVPRPLRSALRHLRGAYDVFR
jgi:hypothetical protein